MESCYPAERLAPKQDPVGQCLLVVQLKRRSPGSGHKPGWPYLTRLVEALQSGTSMDRSKLELAFWLQILKHVYVRDCWVGIGKFSWQRNMVSYLAFSTGKGLVMLDISGTKGGRLGRKTVVRSRAHHRSLAAFLVGKMEKLNGSL